MIYMNNAAKARFDLDVVAAGVASVEKDPWNMSDDGDQERVRELYARIIGADGPSSIAIMPSTTFAITLAAQNLKSTVAGGKILLLQDQYPSAVYPWQDVCQTTGVFSLEIVPYPKESETWTELILERVSCSNHGISIACLPPLFWCDGSLIDLEVIGPLCKEKEIMLIVDATQAAGIYPINVKSIQPTMMACSVHKWLRGPSGTCLVYVDQDVLNEWQPLDQHDRARDWHGRSVADRGTMTPSGYPADFLCGARKLDSGGRIQPILIPMLRAALEKIAELDALQAQAQLSALVKPLREWSQRSPLVHVLASQAHASHILGLMPQKALTTEKMLNIVNQLAANFGIVVAVRCGVIRISPYIDNTDGDVEHLIKALQTVLAQENI